MKTPAITAVVLLAAAFQTSAAEEKKKPARSAELQVLQRFAGTWDHQMTVRTPDGNETEITRVDARRWSKGGSFMIFDNAIESKENPEVQELHMVLGYDPKSKTYPFMFMIGASRGLMRGNWDEESASMTWTGSDPDNGNTWEGKHVFTANGKADVKMTVKNPDGDVILELIYKQTRRKRDAAKKSDKAE